MTKSQLGQTLRALRKERGVSTYRLEKQGFNRSVLHHIENGTSSYTIDTLLKLCEVLQVEVSLSKLAELNEL